MRISLNNIAAVMNELPGSVTQVFGPVKRRVMSRCGEVYELTFEVGLYERTYYLTGFEKVDKITRKLEV